MNIHLPAILMFTRGTRVLTHCHIYIYIVTIVQTIISHFRKAAFVTSRMRSSGALPIAPLVSKGDGGNGGVNAVGFHGHGDTPIAGWFIMENTSING